jgi:superfamily II DNA or RNA helicase
LPTGAGKTRTALAVIARLGRPVLVLAPTRLLVTQWIDALREAGHRGVGKVSDGERRIASVTVATFAGAFHHAPALGDRFCLLVVDEVHHFGAGHGDEALELSVAPFRLGLTATPNTDPSRTARVEALLGPVVYRETISDLAGTWLAPFDVQPRLVDLTPREEQLYRAAEHHWRTAFREFRLADKRRTWMDFVRVAGRTEEGRDAVACWRRCRRIAAGAKAKQSAVTQLIARYRERRVLVFVADNATAYSLARRLLIPAITCEIGQPERTEVLARFERGELRALVSARVLNEGVDVPAADVAIVAGGSHGTREFVQRVGRVLRPREGKRAVVVELLARNTHEEKQAERRRMALVAPRPL